MTDTTTGRYRLLRSDTEAAQDAGSLRGERDCMDAKRLGVPHDSSTPIDFAMRQAENFAYQRGIDVSAVDMFPLVDAWMRGYRDGYEAEQYADEG